MIHKQENELLRLENIAMKEANENMNCHKCGGYATLEEKSIEKHT